MSSAEDSQARASGLQVGSVLSVYDAMQLSHAAYLAGDWEAAERGFRAILTGCEREFDALHFLGLILAQTQRLNEAQTVLSRATEVAPNDPRAHANLGNVLMDLGRADDALASLSRAVDLHPRFADAHRGKGMALRALARPVEAQTAFASAIMVDPGGAMAHYGLGTALAEAGQPEQALASLDTALRLDPRLVEAWNRRGLILAGDHSRLREALDCCDRAIGIRPEHAQSHANRGFFLASLRRTAEAIASYERSIELQPDVPHTRLNLALCQLRAGNFEKGWQEYEVRWHLEGFREVRRRFDQPPWLGAEPIAGRTILLHGEQGFGDTLQFCRYAKTLNQLGARVILLVEQPLVELLAGVDGVAQAVATGGQVPRFDHHCPMMSLPLACGTRLDTIPRTVPYVHADPAKALAWRQKLGPRSKRRIGLVWNGGSRPGHLEKFNERRNMPLASLLPLSSVDAEFYSLQKGAPAEAEFTQRRLQLWPVRTPHDVARDLNDFADTAALIDNLDLVISVDTATAHLAGAMGKPVWLLNRFDSCWRWLQDRDDSPWYPSMRLFGQDRPGDWESVSLRVREALTSFA